MRVVRGERERGGEKGRNVGAFLCSFEQFGVEKVFFFFFLSFLLLLLL